MTYFQGHRHRRHWVMIQPMCFPSLIARPFCFSALFLNSGSQNIIYLFMAGFFFFSFSFNNGSFQETPKDFAQLWVRSGSCQPCPYPAPSHCTSAHGGNSQGRAAALNQLAAELTQGKVKAGNLLWPWKIWKPPGGGVLHVVSAGGGYGGAVAALGTRPHPVARVTFDLCRLRAEVWGLGKILPLSHIPLSRGKAGGHWELDGHPSTRSFPGGA